MLGSRDRMTPSEPASPRRSYAGLPPRVAAGFGAALLSLAVASVAAYAALDARGASGRLVRHTGEAQLALEEIESALLVADLSLQADVAEGAPRRRERFLRASSKIGPGLGELRRISVQHPEERPVIDGLEADLEIVAAGHARVAALLDEGDAAGAGAVLARAHEALERALATLDRIEQDEVNAHAGREAAWRRSVLVSNAVFVAAVLALLALVLLAARLVRDDVRAREAARDERERALVVQQRLMAVVGHDLRNPLAGILAAAWSLARMDLPPRAAAAAQRIVSAGRRMERLIRDLLDWGRAQGGGPIPVAPRESDLLDVCRRIADELRDRDADRIRLEHEGDTRALFDPDRMEQVVANLLSNALRHAPPGSPVVVRAVGTPDEVRVEVRDVGPGVAPEVRARIFEPFRRGPGATGPGIGLGLFVVRAVADAHGGTVELSSAPGETTFAVRLPRGAPHPARASPAA